MSNVIKSSTVLEGIIEKRIINMNVEEVAENTSSTIKTEYDEKDSSNDSTENDSNVIKEDYSKTLKERELSLKREEEMINKKADEIIKNAGDTAKSIISAARKQAETICEQAVIEGNKKGYEEGYKKGEDQITQLKLELEEEFERQNASYDEKTSKFEADFVDLVSSIIEKITGIIVEDKNEVIMHIINRALNDSENSNTYVIRVSKEDFEFVSEQKKYLYDCINEGASLEIVESDNLDRNKCLIETDNNVIDCSLDSQITNLITELKMLSRL